MKKEWVIVALLIVGVAGLELFGGGNGETGPPRSPDRADTVVGTEPSPTPARPAAADSDPQGPFRTVRLHVTGMT